MCILVLTLYLLRLQFHFNSLTYRESGLPRECGFPKNVFRLNLLEPPAKNLDLESGMRLVVHTNLLYTSILAKIFPSDMSYIDEEIIAAPLIYRLCGVGPISKSGHAATICSATISNWIVILGLNSCRCSDFKHQLIP